MDLGERRAQLLAAVRGSSASTKVLGAALVGSYLVGRLAPGRVASLALVPDKVVPRVWTLATAGLYEWNAGGLCLNLLTLFHVGQRLERVWGSREYLTFLAVVNCGVGAAAFATMYVLYIVTFDQFYLFAQFGGFQGSAAALLLALRQVAPETEVPLPLLRQAGLRYKHLVGAYLSAALLLALSSGAEHHHIGLFLFAAYGAHISWLYLRFYQPVSAAVGGGSAAAGLRGDPRDEFAFSALWPPPLQPLVARASAPFYRIFCIPPPAEAAAAAAAAHAAAARAAASSDPSTPRQSSRMEELGARGLRLLQQRMASFGSGREWEAAAAGPAADVEAAAGVAGAAGAGAGAAGGGESQLPAMAKPPPEAA